MSNNFVFSLTVQIQYIPTFSHTPLHVELPKSAIKSHINGTLALKKPLIAAKYLDIAADIHTHVAYLRI